MKTHINIGDEVVVAGKKGAFDGIVKGKHLFSYDIYHVVEHTVIDFDGDGYTEVYSTIKRYPKRKVYWKSDNDKIIRDFESRVKARLNEDEGD